MKLEAKQSVFADFDSDSEEEDIYMDNGRCTLLDYDIVFGTQCLLLVLLQILTFWHCDLELANAPAPVSNDQKAIEAAESDSDEEDESDSDDEV